MSASTCREMLIDSSSDADGMDVMRHMIAPSFRFGMNSLPRNGNSMRLAASATPAMPSTGFRRASAHSSTGA